MQVSLREVTTAAALEEKQKLQKGLGYIDMIFFTAAALIGLDTLGAFSANGGQALTVSGLESPVIHAGDEWPSLVRGLGWAWPLDEQPSAMPVEQPHYPRCIHTIPECVQSLAYLEE